MFYCSICFTLCSSFWIMPLHLLYFLANREMVSISSHSHLFFLFLFVSLFTQRVYSLYWFLIDFGMFWIATNINGSPFSMFSLNEWFCILERCLQSMLAVASKIYMELWSFLPNALVLANMNMPFTLIYDMVIGMYGPSPKRQSFYFYERFIVEDSIL